MLKLVKYLFLNAILYSLVNSSPILVKPTEEQATSQLTATGLCEASEFKYFQPHPTNAAKYIQCDPWGTGVEKSCDNGTVWNMWSLKCDFEANIKNLTFTMPPKSVEQTAEPFNCSLVGVECLNGGVCSQSMMGSFKCVCKSEFTGEFCETKVDLTDLSHEILNGTFSVVDYKLRLIEENVTVELGFYERYKDQLDEVTYTELMKYLSMYKQGEVRYDTLVNYLIEDILQDIYPDAQYLSSFNASAQSVVSMVRLIPSLLSYSRYSFERYEDVFAQYQKVLTGLVSILNSTVPTIKEEAYEYSTLTGIFLNQTMMIVNQTLMNTENRTLMVENQSMESMQLSDMDVKNSLRSNFNSTLQTTERLFQSLDEFQMNVIDEMSRNSNIYNLTLAEAKFSGAQETLMLFTEISASSSQIWDSLVNYGFWFLTNMFTQPIKKETMARFSLALDRI